ncbi:MAG TPA: helix-hairpin-helix domain-containing protein, partial [Verrucomicrobiae bacterium]|nr:helix-hairpin-helix domain-containing protein [Verrucomicrobiae bacterium]
AAVQSSGITSLQTNLEEVLGIQRAAQIMTQVTSSRQSYNSPLQFFVQAGLSPSEIPLVETIVRGSNIVGLINVNTASLAVLNCIPGLTNGMAQNLVSYRASNTNNLNGSIAWVTQVLDANTIAQAGPYLTGRSYQYTVDVAALGHNGRGYRRVRFVYDTRRGVPVIVHRQDLSRLGWALGKEVRDKWLLGKPTS